MAANPSVDVNSALLVEDLDAFEARQTKERKKISEATGHGSGIHFAAYRHIEEHWYLYYED